MQADLPTGSRGVLTAFRIYFRLLSEQVATWVAHQGKSCLHQTHRGKEESRWMANTAIPSIFINLHLVEVFYVTKPLSKLHSTLGEKKTKKRQSNPFQGALKQTGLPPASWTLARTPQLTSLRRCEKCCVVFNYKMQVRPCFHTAPPPRGRHLQPRQRVLLSVR